MYLTVTCTIHISIIHEQHNNRKELQEKTFTIKDTLRYKGYIKAIYCLISIQVFWRFVNQINRLEMEIS